MHIFVYGSLKKGFPNHALLGSSAFLGTAKTKQPMYMIGLLSGAYPYVTSEKIHPSLQASPIHGELYEVSEDVLEVLDRLEGHPTHYIRQSVDLDIGSAYMYLLQDSDTIECITQCFLKRFFGIPTGIWEWKQGKD